MRDPMKMVGTVFHYVWKLCKEATQEAEQPNTVTPRWHSFLGDSEPLGVSENPEIIGGGMMTSSCHRCLLVVWWLLLVPSQSDNRTYYTVDEQSMKASQCQSKVWLYTAIGSLDTTQMIHRWCANDTVVKHLCLVGSLPCFPERTQGCDQPGLENGQRLQAALGLK